MNPAQSADPYEFHKLRYLDSALPRELRIASGQWLLDHGFVGIYGKQILPFGELPK